MSTPVGSLLPPVSQQPPHVEPVSGVVSVADDAGVTASLDFLLITSRVDFDRSYKKFMDECNQAGVHADTLFVEDLPGRTPGEKLASLHQISASWNANGKVVASTIKVELLHGRIDVEPADHSLGLFRQEYLGIQETQRQSGQDGNTTSSAPAKIHMMTAAAGKLVFPTDLFNVALRATVVNDGQTNAGFGGTIVYSACGSGVFRDTAKQSEGSYVIASGKKSVFTEDFNAGLSALVRDQGNRKRQGSPPLSARDCWRLLRDQSGEHVALVGNDTIEINKVLQSGHSEPAINVRSEPIDQRKPEEISDQAVRTLLAKIHHGSAKSVRQVIDRWGPGILSADHGAVIPGMSLWSLAIGSKRDSEQKVLLLVAHTPGNFLQKSMLETWIKVAIERSWTSVLSRLFKRMADTAPLPLSLERVVIWMRSHPEQTNKLTTLCRKSRDLSEYVGDYLYQAHLAESNPNHLALRNFFLPPFFEGLAKKAADRARKGAAQ
jgi:hypothetical protein